MKYAKLTVAFILFLGISYLGVDLFRNSSELQNTKAQYSEINHFSYGLFSVNEWKRKISVIISDEIGNLSIEGKTEETVKKQLERQLVVLIDKINSRIRTENDKTAQGRLKQSFIDSFVKVEEIKAGIPDYADALMKEITSPRAEKEIRGLLKTKVDGYMNDTFDKKVSTLKDALVEQFGQGDEDKAKAFLAKKLSRGKDRSQEKAWIMIGLSILLFLVIGISQKPLHQPEYFLLTLTLLVLMFVGITTPMIDMEARISELSFVLFDHQVVFKEQILFFQSKSILDVFQLMITHKEIQMKLVGVLLVTFSVLFPMFKLLATLTYYYDYCSARSKKLITFFVLKSGKWSMADVMVVAIFMAYIGFNGIVNSQLNNIKKAGADLDMLTTNGTSLQPGYYIFLAYTLLAMFLSNFLKKRSYQCSTEN